MLVSELIDILKTFPQDLKVWVSDSAGEGAIPAITPQIVNAWNSGLDGDVIDDEYCTSNYCESEEIMVQNGYQLVQNGEIWTINDTMVWTSESRTLLIWDSEKGTNCGIRWRAKLTCTGTSFICEVIGYPLADNTPCMKCYGTLGTPIPADLSVTMLLAWSQLTADCPCMGPSIATSIKVEQI